MGRKVLVPNYATVGQGLNALARAVPAQKAPAGRPTNVTASCSGASAKDCAEACERAARRFPQLAEPWFRRGVIFEQVEDEAASAAYRRALAVDENHLGSLLNLASLLHGQEQPAEVVHDLWRRALAVDAQAGGLQADERTRILALLGQ